MSDVNTHLRIKDSYENFVKNFSFSENIDFDSKADKVCIKSVFLFLIVEAVALTINYIHSVFMSYEHRAFSTYINSHFHNVEFLGVVFLTIVASLGVRAFIKRMYFYSQICQVDSKDEIDKIVELAKEFPKLGEIVTERINTQGFLSEMDYSILCIDRVYKDLQLKKENE